MKKLGLVLSIAVFGVLFAACSQQVEEASTTLEAGIEGSATVDEAGEAMQEIGEAMKDDAMEAEEAMDGEDKMMKEGEAEDETGAMVKSETSVEVMEK